MITSSQRTEGCIALNKLKLLISEAAYIYDLKSLYTAIENGINGAAAGAGDGAAAGAAAGAGDGAAAGGATGAGDGATAGANANISTTWLESKLTELKNEINLTLTEITNQIKNNI